AAVRNPFLLDLPEKSDGRVLDLSLIKKCEPNSFASGFHPEDYIPVSMSPSGDESYVGTAIFFHSIDRLASSPRFRGSAVGQVASVIDESLKTQMEFRAGEEKIRHQVQFQLKAADAKATINYKGFVEAQLAYEMNSQTVNLQMKRPIGQGTQIIFDHFVAATEARDTLTLMWVF
ncbi:MAG: hypothetical protein KDD35_10535, partial [Bdellovibrionales bacterium]|nr:hypothetical protein [Bdellovibrionales bacterium]